MVNEKPKIVSGNPVGGKTISKRTENLMDCLFAMDELQRNIRGYIAELYSEEYGKVISNEFYEEYYAIKNRIEKVLLISIDEDLGDDA